MSLDLVQAHRLFAASTDFTVGIEEEFQILDPETLQLTAGFEQLHDAAQLVEGLKDSVAGELISSEIEIRSGRGDDFAHAVELQAEHRAKLFTLADENDFRLAALGAHPFSPWQDQRIIDTEHYHRVEDGLKYVAWRNNTFSLHVHVGVNDADRAIAVCDRVREVLPELLAISASSALAEGRDSGLASARTQIFTRMFPRCGIPDPWGDWKGYSDFVEFLKRTDSIVESTQLWWSVRPHHSFGTVEVRICDAQPDGDDSSALSGLIVACVAQAARDYDNGIAFTPQPARMLEENLWRAIRFGLDGNLIDLSTGEQYPATEVVSRLLEWTAPARAELAINPKLPARNATQRLRDAGLGPYESLEESVRETARTYGRSVRSID